MNIKHSLYIRYGLQDYPSDKQVLEWVHQVEVLIEEGIEVNEAGTQAAKIIFQDYESILRFSEADTVQTLLAAARKRKSSNNGN